MVPLLSKADAYYLAFIYIIHVKTHFLHSPNQCICPSAHSPHPHLGPTLSLSTWKLKLNVRSAFENKDKTWYVILLTYPRKCVFLWKTPVPNTRENKNYLENLVDYYVWLFIWSSGLLKWVCFQAFNGNSLKFNAFAQLKFAWFSAKCNKWFRKNNIHLFIT